MKTLKLYGLIEIEGEKRPFFLNDSFLGILDEEYMEFFDSDKTIINETEIEAETYSGQKLTFIDNKIVSLYPFVIAPRIIIKWNTSELEFDSITFNGGMMNKIYDPVRYSINSKETKIDKENSGYAKIVYLPFSETNYEFSFDEDGEKHKILYGINRMINHRYDKYRKQNSNISLEFNNKKNSKDVMLYVSSISSLLRIISFRSDFAIDSIDLKIKKEDGFYYKIGKVYSNQKKSNVRFRTPNEQITNFNSRFGELFTYILDLEKSNVEKGSISVSNNDLYTVNRKSLIDISTFFEFNFREKFGAVKEDDTNKNYLKSIKKFAKNNKNEETDMTYYRVKELLNNYDLSFIKRLKMASETFPEITDFIMSKLNLTNNPEETKSLLNTFKDSRNSLVHGSLINYNNAMAQSFIYVRLISYSSFLSNVGYENREILDIVKQIYF